MRTSIFLLWLTMIAGCTPYLPPVIKHYPVGSNAAVLDRTTVISRTDSLVFDLQMSFLDLEGYYDIGDVRPSDFTFTSPGHYNIIDFKMLDSSGVGQTQAVILEDESGNYDLLDHFNFRSKMLNRLCQDIQDPGSFMIGGFSRQGKILTPSVFSTTGFTTDWESQQDFIFGLTQETGGQSSLYDALTDAIAKFTVGPNKNIVALVRSVDGGSESTVDDVVNAANAAHVSINILFLGNASDVGDIPRIGGLTGGKFAVVSYPEMITVFNQMYRLLTGNRHIYNIRVSYRPDSGVFSTPDVTHSLNVLDYTTGKSYNPVVIYTKIP